MSSRKGSLKPSPAKEPTKSKPRASTTDTTTTASSSTPKPRRRSSTSTTTSTSTTPLAQGNVIKFESVAQTLQRGEEMTDVISSLQQSHTPLLGPNGRFMKKSAVGRLKGQFQAKEVNTLAKEAKARQKDEDLAEKRRQRQEKAKQAQRTAGRARKAKGAMDDDDDLDDLDAAPVQRRTSKRSATAIPLHPDIDLKNVIEDHLDPLDSSMRRSTRIDAHKTAKDLTDDEFQVGSQASMYKPRKYVRKAKPDGIPDVTASKPKGKGKKAKTTTAAPATPKAKVVKVVKEKENKADIKAKAAKEEKTKIAQRSTASAILKIHLVSPVMETQFDTVFSSIIDHPGYPLASGIHCPICQVVFNKADFDTHIQYHILFRSRNFLDPKGVRTCAQCSCTYSQPHLLHQHRDDVHGSGQTKSTTQQVAPKSTTTAPTTRSQPPKQTPSKWHSDPLSDSEWDN